MVARFRRWLASHENLYTFLWYLHLVRNKPPWSGCLHQCRAGEYVLAQGMLHDGASQGDCERATGPALHPRARETITIMTDHTREEEIDFMSHPDRWPHGFVLPLKHATRKQDNGWPEHAFLLQPSMRTPAPPPDPVVRLGTLGIVKVSEAEQVRYESLEAVYDAGWRVD